MSRAPLALVSCVAVAALLASCASLSEDLRVAEQAPVPSLVQFTYDALNPATVSIPAGGLVRWENMAPETRAYVVFATKIASAFRCQDLHPYFRKAGSVYRSLPITGIESDRVQLPCPLAPGSYDYEVWLVGAGFGAVEEVVDPQQILRGKIVVQ